MSEYDLTKEEISAAEKGEIDMSVLESATPESQTAEKTFDSDFGKEKRRGRPKKGAVLDENSIKLSLNIKEKSFIEKFNRIRELERYGENKALALAAMEKGLLLIEAKEFGIRGEDEKKTEVFKVQELSEETASRITKLLSELCISTVVIKSMLATLYNYRLLTIEGNNVGTELFSSGALLDLPPYLEEYETEELKKLREKIE